MIDMTYVTITTDAGFAKHWLYATELRCIFQIRCILNRCKYINGQLSFIFGLN